MTKTLLVVTVVDEGNACLARLETAQMPAWQRRAAIEAARSCLDQTYGEMMEEVNAATLKRDLDK